MCPHTGIKKKPKTRLFIHCFALSCLTAGNPISQANLNPIRFNWRLMERSPEVTLTTDAF